MNAGVLAVAGDAFRVRGPGRDPESLAPEDVFMFPVPTMHRKALYVLVGAVALAVYVATLDIGNEAPPKLADAPIVVTDTPGPAAADQPARPTVQQLDHVQGFLFEGDQLARASARTARSTQHANGWYVVARVYRGDESYLGAWLLAGDPESPGTTLSVNPEAITYSYAPDGMDTDAEARCVFDPACEALLEALE